MAGAITEELERPLTGPLPSGLRPAWAEVDLAALVANLRLLRRRIDDLQVMAVIKADAYGHGAPEVSKALAAGGVDMLGAALVEEGAEVRRAGVETPILILGVAQDYQLPYYRRFGLTPVISACDQLRMWKEWLEAPGGYAQPFHLKVDTGMTRLGIAESELGDALALIRSSPRLRLAGLMSHFAEADLLESPRNADQERRFAAVADALTPEERRRVTVHLGNSAGALHHPPSRHDMARIGLGLYGYDPAGIGDEGLAPVMAVKTRIVLVRRIAPGTRVSYGGRWTAERPSVIGVLPVGYADGYAWRLTGKAAALVRGRRLPIVGAVSMDMIFVDLTDHPEAAVVGEEVVLLGRQGDETIPVTELAGHAGTLPYELLCLLGLRLARRYVGGPADDVVRSRFEGARR